MSHKIGKIYIKNLKFFVMLLLLFRAQFRIEISKLKLKSDLLTLKTTHHKGKNIFSI
jgi:hypothetical protein